MNFLRSFLTTKPYVTLRRNFIVELKEEEEEEETLSPIFRTFNAKRFSIWLWEIRLLGADIEGVFLFLLTFQRGKRKQSKMISDRREGGR